LESQYGVLFAARGEYSAHVNPTRVAKETTIRLWFLSGWSTSELDAASTPSSATNQFVVADTTAHASSRTDHHVVTHQYFAARTAPAVVVVNDDVVSIAFSITDKLHIIVPDTTASHSRRTNAATAHQGAKGILKNAKRNSFEMKTNVNNKIKPTP